MPYDFKLERSKNQTKQHDSLHIKNGKRGGSISGYINIARFQDKDTNQWVLYVPSLDISGYGETPDKAFSMLKSSLDEWFKQLLEMSANELRREMFNYGWKKSKFSNKDFSRAYVDGDGELKNFNTDKVEHLALIA